MKSLAGGELPQRQPADWTPFFKCGEISDVLEGLDGNSDELACCNDPHPATSPEILAD